MGSPFNYSLMSFNSLPEGRSCVVNIYRDLAMCSARNSKMAPYTELIVANLDTYCAGNQTRHQMKLAFGGLRDAANAEPIARHFASRAVDYINEELHHEHMMDISQPLPF